MAQSADSDTNDRNGRAPIGKRVVAGIGLLVLAFLLWSLRESVPSWVAKNMAATVELATTTERDDARVTRAFEAALQDEAADATLELLANPTKVRHAQLTVRAPTSDRAIERASRLSLAMARAFVAEGDGHLSVDIRRRTVYVPDRTTMEAGTALRIGAALAGGLGVLLIARGWVRSPAGPARLPRQLWWPIAVLGAIVSFALAVFFSGAFG